MLLSTIEYEILTRFTASQRDGDPECDECFQITFALKRDQILGQPTCRTNFKLFFLKDAALLSLKAYFSQ